MNESQHKNDDRTQRLDAATSQRLAKLGAMPVDASGLQAKLRRAMDEQRQPASYSWAAARRWLRPATSIAAMILIAVMIGWLAIEGGSTPAVAAPSAMALLHQQVAAEIDPSMRATSVEQANQLLAAQFAGDHQTMAAPMHACCLREYAGASLSCVMMEQDGELVSIAVADADHLRSPEGRTVVRDGRSFTLHEADGVNMVMANQGKRWLCVMGKVPSDQLLDIAAKIRFANHT